VLDSFNALASSARATQQGAAVTVRLTRGLPRYLRHPFTPDEARHLLLRRLATREQRFLTVVEQAIYDHPRSPYLALLRSAGCELGDVQQLVVAEGLDGTLRTLARRGVYVTFDELKGRRDAVRGSQRFAFSPPDFDNPMIRPDFLRFTGGSTGRPTRAPYTLPYFAEWATSFSLALQAHRLHQPRVAFWRPIPMAQAIVFGMLGHPALGWFYPVHPLPASVHLAARYLRVLGQSAGYTFPLPRRCDLARPDLLARWLTAQVHDGGPLVLWTMPSAAARLGTAATEAGLDLQGVTMLVGGEPTTAARRAHVERASARLIVTYSTVELTGLSYSCATPTAPDDVHVMLDLFAVVTHPRPAGPGGPLVDACLLTSPSPVAGMVLFNAEMGDYARIEERDCDCLLGALGLRTHLSEIRSFEKLTGEGVTFARSNLERILEEILPARFGGTMLDYQLAEEERPDSATGLVLRVSPSVGDVDEAAIRETVLDHLGRSGPVEQHQIGFWRGTGAIEIRRERPVATRAGKVLPFHLLTRAESVVRPP
jgi:hypothetical protein